MIIAAVALGIVSIPLVVTGLSRTANENRESQGAPIVHSWIGDRDLVVVDWSISGSAVDLGLSGPDLPGDEAQLAQSLATAFGVPVDLDVHYVVATHTTSGANP
jgi:hypothetical protein